MNAKTILENQAPLARSAVRPLSKAFSPELVLWEEALPGGTQWSGVIRRGNTLRITDLEGSANVAAMLYNAECLSERYSMPDTLKAQHTAFLTKGNVCYSDMGRVLCSISEDQCGWHDTIGGLLGTVEMREKYGPSSYQGARNEMHRSAIDGALIELGKWGLDERDVVPNLNLFSKVSTDSDGRLRFVTEHRRAGQYVDLRFEMDVLLVLSTAPHPLDPSRVWQPGRTHLTLWKSGTAGADDECRLLCAENERGFINTERYFL